ncbi:MAG: hypothetical protein ACJ76J_20060 [Thermoanaerobaculia bacterium]
MAPPTRDTGIVTVAAIREAKGRILIRLREAMEQGRAVRVRLPSVESGVIEDVEAPLS